MILNTIYASFNAFQAGFRDPLVCVHDTMAKRSARTTTGSGKKRARKADDAADDAGFFLLDDDDAKRRQESDEEEEDMETAEQKRIRLAREYLDGLKATQGGDEDDTAADARTARFKGVTGGFDDEDDELAARLREDALEAQGKLQRKLAHRIQLPQQQTAAAIEPSSSSSSRYGTGRFSRAHRLSPTAVALTADETTAFSVSKDGSIIRWDLETMKRTQLTRPGSKAAAAAGTTADWVKSGPRLNPTSSLLAAAVSSDGKLLAVGGGDKQVHVFDAVTGEHVRSYPGHRDQVSCLSFREGTHTLYSGGYDRTVKIWSLDDAAYVDTLFGHQAEVFAIDSARTERVVSVGHDHTCRLWKIPEESHLVFRSPSMAQHAVALVTGGSEWVSGGCDGSLQVWNTLKKKPVSIYHSAHRGLHTSTTAAAAAAAAGDQDTAAAAAAPIPPDRGSWATANVDTCCWVQSLAACRGSDFVASGAGDGFIRLWAVQPSKHGGAGTLKQVGELPAVGFVNGLALGKSGRICVAALGQEPRLGRWGRVAQARNGLLVHRWDLAADE